MKILENTAFFFIAAIIIGLVYPGFSGFLSQYIILFFIIAATLSLTHMKLTRMDVKENAKASVKTVLLSYGLLSGVTILAAYLLVPNPEHLAGFVIMAAAPPAVAIIPFTYLLRGNSKIALGGELLNYILALALAPMITLFLLGSGVDIFEILKALTLIIILPLILSRFLIRHPHSSDSLQKIIVNFCFAFINYSIIGLNHAVIFSDPVALWPILLVHFLTVFGAGALVYLAGRRLRVSKDRCIPYTLFGSIKNGAMSATLAILIVSPAASLPAALHGAFTISFFLLLEYLLRRR
jgi:BASS family bile acid:Na+ symporter